MVVWVALQWIVWQQSPLTPSETGPLQIGKLCAALANMALTFSSHAGARSHLQHMMSNTALLAPFTTYTLWDAVAMCCR